MNTGRLWMGWIAVGLLTACGGAQREADAPALAASPSDETAESASEAASTDAAAPEAPSSLEAPSASLSALPTECAAGSDLCLPERAFVKRLCRDAFTGAAIVLFEKRSPFSRGYVLSREVQAVNTLGGPASDAKLRFGEEVVILTHTGGGNAREMQVSGMGGYEVLRWDGTCATLAEGELATRAPTAARHAPFAWRDIDTSIQNALLRDSTIEAARRAHRQHCHGVSLGAISPACVKAEAQLGESIVAAVRTGIELPKPDRMP